MLLNCSYNGNGKSFPEKNGKTFQKTSEKYSSSSVVIDAKLCAVLILGAIFIFLNKFFVNSMPFAEDGFIEVSKYAQQSIEDAWEWVYTSHEENKSYILPILFGIGFTVFSWIFVYLDSHSPGIHPPSPFSPTSKYKYRQQKTSSMHIGYTTAVLSGIVVTGLIFYDF